VAKIAVVAKDYLHKDIYLLMGELHLLDMSGSNIREIITKMKELGAMTSLKVV